MIQKHRSILLLEDGKQYYGWSFTNTIISVGEVVFNTGMTGYQEILTDPSYNGQIIIFTYPEIGNTGINEEDSESTKFQAIGIIAKNFCATASNWRHNSNIKEYFLKYKIPHIFGIDTRSLTKHLRNSGIMNGCIASSIFNANTIKSYLYNASSINQADLVSQVATEKSYLWISKQSRVKLRYKIFKRLTTTLYVIVIDFGVKSNILNILSEHGCKIKIVPVTTKYEEIIKQKPDGILLSNGPGNPSILNQAITTVKKLTETNIPLFGICMGHQILSLALGGSTFKLKFGHRGLNHPSGSSQKVEITSQNHSFAVKENSLPNDILHITQLNLNDRSIASIVHKLKPIFSVQYHPEASPGPHDSIYLFEHFIKIMETYKYSKLSI